MEIITPGQIVGELQRLTKEMDKGANALYDAECRMADAENTYDTTLAKSFIANAGTVADRQMVAKLQAADDRLKADLAKAEFNRVKVKIKMLSDQATMTAVMAKQVEMMWKNA